MSKRVDITRKRVYQINGPEMDYHINDMTYGLLLSYADYKRKEKKLYTAKAMVNEYFEYDLDDMYTLHTIVDKHIKKLKEVGLVSDGEYEWYGKKTKAYVIKNRTDCEGAPFQLIDADIIYKIVTEVGLVNSLKIYVYLLNRYMMERKDKFVLFSLYEISKALGYAETSKRQNKTIIEILDKLKFVGLIDYEKKTKRESYSDKTYILIDIKYEMKRRARL